MLEHIHTNTVLFVSTRTPFPPDDGHKIVLFNYCKYVAEHLGRRVILATFDEPDSCVPPSFIADVVHLRRPNIYLKIPELFFGLLLGNGIPLQSRLYHSRGAAQELTKYIAEYNVDNVVFDMVRTAIYIDSVPEETVRIVDLDDLLSIRYERTALHGSTTPVGNAAGGFLAAFNSLARRLGLIRWITRREAKMLKQYERHLALVADHTILVSPLEAQILREQVDSKVWAIPVGVDTKHFYPHDVVPQHGVVSFIGSLDVPHNEISLLYFLDNVWPTVKHQFPDAVFRILGKNPTREIIRAVKVAVDVHLVGRVEDQRPLIQSSTVFVAPMVFGSGIKTKILEALAMGVPVVTNEIGAEGIVDSFSLEGPLLIAKTDTEFASRVVQVLESSELRQRLSHNGLSFVSEKFDWGVTLQGWRYILGE